MGTISPEPGQVDLPERRDPGSIWRFLSPRGREHQPPEAVPLCAAIRQTTAQAVALLDAQFPWLRCAEKRHPVCGVAGRSMLAPVKPPSS